MVFILPCVLHGHTSCELMDTSFNELNQEEPEPDCVHFPVRLLYVMF